MSHKFTWKVENQRRNTHFSIAKGYDPAIETLHAVLWAMRWKGEEQWSATLWYYTKVNAETELLIKAPASEHYIWVKFG